jgi:hypothetical protein
MVSGVPHRLQKVRVPKRRALYRTRELLHQHLLDALKFALLPLGKMIDFRFHFSA